MTDVAYLETHGVLVLASGVIVPVSEVMYIFRFRLFGGVDRGEGFVDIGNADEVLTAISGVWASDFVDVDWSFIGPMVRTRAGADGLMARSVKSIGL